MPNLKSLDLSNNLLISLKKDPFENLTKLEFLNLEQNKWKCGDVLKEILGWFRKNVIKVEVEKCCKYSFYNFITFKSHNVHFSPFNGKNNLKIRKNGAGHELAK
jgi:Leucine-rich repeat (LRR) protein